MSLMLIIQGCSNNKQNISQDKIQAVINSINIDRLEKAEYDPANNKISIYTEDEAIDEKGFESIINSVTLNNLSGNKIDIANLKSDDFDNKKILFEVITKNNNTVSFSTTNAADKKFTINNKEFTNDYVSYVVKGLSADIISFDELTGTLETDLNNGADISAKKEKIANINVNIDSKISVITNFNENNTKYEKLSGVKTRLQRIETLLATMRNQVDAAITAKNGSAIAANFLVINDLDLLARQLKDM